MNHSLSRLKKAIPGFNKKIFTADDFWRLARREGIRVDFWKLTRNIHGFYGVNRRYKKPVRYIVINPCNLPDRWLYVGFHELIHHFLHAPVTELEVYFSKDHASARQEREADMFARMLLIPKPLLLELVETPFEEIIGLSEKDLRARWTDYQRIGE